MEQATNKSKNIYAQLFEGVYDKLKNSSTTFSLVIVYLVICIVFANLSPYFFSVNNFLNIGIYSSIIGIMGAGVTVAMLLGAIDISQYSVATIASIVSAVLLSKGIGNGPVILIALLIGIVAGSVNGLLVSILKISPIIATLGTMQIFRGIAYLVTSGKTIMIDSEEFAYIGTGYLFDRIPLPIIIAVVVFIITYYVLRYTAFGRKIFAVGDNEDASYLSGINVVGIKFGALVICSMTAAIAGLILSSQIGAAIPSTGTGQEMGVLSAVILGGISLNGGKGRVSGTVIGILILATIQNGLTLLSVQSFYQMIINGLVLILAVLMDVVRSGELKKK